jgi:mannose-6-phosphate isomerase-like protein (cupin superfamily)
MSDPAAVQTILGPREGRNVAFRGLGVRFMIDAARSGGGFSLVEHPIAPRTLASPLHVHRNEDEYSYVLEGEVGVQVGDEVRYARPGDLVFKPRGIWHAFWNRADDPARLLEIISPAGFEGYFAEIAPLLPPNRAEPDLAALAAARARYGLQMDMDSIAGICERERLPLP